VGGRLIRLTAAVAAAVALGVAAGCGDDDESAGPATTAAAITKAEFIAQADKICADADAAIEEEASATFTTPGPPDAATLEAFATGTLLPSLQAQHDDIAALPQPSGDEAEIDAILAALQQGIDEGTADPSLLATDAGPPGVARATTLAQEYGMQECGSS
jgi:hypothetical protein